MQATKCLLGLRKKSADRRRIGDVGRDGECIPFGSPGHGHSFFESLYPSPRQHHLITSSKQRECDHATDTAPGAGDQGDFGKIRHEEIDSEPDCITRDFCARIESSDSRAGQPAFSRPCTSASETQLRPGRPDSGTARMPAGAIVIWDSSSPLPTWCHPKPAKTDDRNDPPEVNGLR